MTKRLEDQVATLLEDLIPPANAVDFGDVARRVIKLIDEHRREHERHDGVSP